MKRTTQRIIPGLNYADAPGALAFLERAFGFKETYRYMDGERVGHAVVELAGNTLTLASTYPEFGFGTPNDLGGTSCQLEVLVDDLDAHFAAAKAAGASVVEPADEHGRRHYRAVDPEGYRWIFTQRTEEN